MKNTKSNIGYIVTIIAAFIPITWEMFSTECKELTICEEKQIEIYDMFNNEYIIYTKDSLRLDNYRIVEYSITNTGNTTIVGTGVHSDLLVDDNSLQIAPDSVIIKISNKDESINLVDNHIRFKQIKPNEKITLICASQSDENTHLIRISDRDIKDTDIIYTKRNNKLTTFEKTTSTNRWIAALSFLFNLIIIFIFIVISSLDVLKDLKIKNIVFLIIWLPCLIYTLLLPIRWLL